MQRSIVGFICTAFTAASTYFGLSNLLSVTTYRPAPLAQDINLVRAPPLERDAGFGHGMPTLQFAGSRIAQQARADMLISIHLNAAEDASASGYETYIRADSEMMFDMAQQVHAEFAERGWSHERGIKSTVNAPLYVVDASGMDAMLVEAGFITNAAELALLRSEDGQQMLAECIAQGILSQLQAQNTEE